MAVCSREVAALNSPPSAPNVSGLLGVVVARASRSVARRVGVVQVGAAAGLRGLAAAREGA